MAMNISEGCSFTVAVPSNAGWLETVTRLAHGSLNSKPEPITNVVAVAMANKLARIAWVVLNRQQEYRHCRIAVESAGFGRPVLDTPVAAADQGSPMNSQRSALTGV
jgi:hypothetical protein